MAARGGLGLGRALRAAARSARTRAWACAGAAARAAASTPARLGTVPGQRWRGGGAAVAAEGPGSDGGGGIATFRLARLPPSYDHLMVAEVTFHQSRRPPHPPPILSPIVSPAQT